MELTKKPKSPSDWAKAIHKAFLRESDRAAAIVAGAMLDEALLAVLRARLVKPISKGKSLVDGPNGPLGTFSARIDAAHQFGLISKHLARDLHIIRKIRNEFAHEPLEATFNTGKIADLVCAVEAASDYNTRHPGTRTAMGPPGKGTSSGSWLGFSTLFSATPNPPNE